jgi:plasmid maintenance system antidote protein VapI
MAELKTQGQRLRHAMEKLQISRQELAHAIDVSLSAVAMVCVDQHTLRKVTACAIEREFKISADWLLNGAGKMLLPTSEPISERAKALALMLDRMDKMDFDICSRLIRLVADAKRGAEA